MITLLSSSWRLSPQNLRRNCRLALTGHAVHSASQNVAPRPAEAGGALLVTLFLTTAALLAVGATLAYTTSTARLNYRLNQYNRAVSAAEATTEKVVSLMTRDYLSGGEALVLTNMATYRSTTMTSSDSSFWSDWQFNDTAGNVGRTYVNGGGNSNYVVITSIYAGLRGYASVYNIVSNARQTGVPQDVTGGVMQQVQLSRIPIFQFAMYSWGEMEVSCGQPFVISGRVHSNGILYVEPDNALTFQSDVTAVGDILFQRDPLDTRAAPSGSVVYEMRKDAHVMPMTLPIGLTNSPLAVRELIQPPPPLESATSALGKLRYYNLVDMVLVITNGTTNTLISGTSGNFNGFSTAISSKQLKTFVTVNTNFWDEREGKTVLPVDIDIGNLTAWSATNVTLRGVMSSNNLWSVYVWDRRTLPADNLAAVRVKNGAQLPPRGLTIVTARPLYVWGHFNQPTASNLGTTNTTTTLPASLVGDALTILSPSWDDSQSSSGLGNRVASGTTVNAAILAGAVDTVAGTYSGGMENFPRFLEHWGLENVLTYNGSMVKMFPSLYATNAWGGGNVYDPPARNWTYDGNFDNPAKLPPLTPSVQKLIRSDWATTAPGKTNAPVIF
jgi:hypothetical protein